MSCERGALSMAVAGPSRQAAGSAGGTGPAPRAQCPARLEQTSGLFCHVVPGGVGQRRNFLL